MANMREECTTKEHNSVMRFLWATGRSANDIHEEMVPDYGDVCHVKRFTTGSRNSLKEVRMSQMMPYQVALLRLRQTQRLLCCGFRRTGKAMRQGYVNVGGGYFEKYMFFPGSNITCFTFYIYL
jgi:hypothetical protein